MADPISAAVAFIGSALASAGTAVAAHPFLAAAAIGGAGLSAAGAARATAAENRNLETQAMTARANAGIASENASLDSQRRQNELRDSRRRTNLISGSARAQSGALGIFGGSSLDVLADVDTQGIFEQSSIIRERTGSQNSSLRQAANEKSKANAFLASKQSGFVSALLAGGTSLITSAAGFPTA